MNLSLAGKTAIVSGSTGGIGYKTVVGLAKLGASVVISGRTQERVDAAVQNLKKELEGGSANAVHGIAVDLATAEGAEKLFKSFPTTDILVNNLGIFEPKPFLEIPDGDWTRMFEVNVMSGVRLSRFYLPKMLANNWGRIVFVSSESGMNVAPEMIHYSVTKTAQLVLGRGLAEMTKGTGVTVNSVTPGPTQTDGVNVWMKKVAAEKGLTIPQLEEQFFKETRPTSLLLRFLTEEEVANAIIYLSTPASSGTNGTTLKVDGGLVRSFT